FAQAINNTIRSNTTAGTTAGRNPVIVNIIGRGHIDYGFGVSHQLKSLGINNIISLTPWDDFLHCDQMTNSNIAVADAVFGTAAKIEHGNNAKPKLGVFIEQGEGGVAVKKVAPESVAESAGIKSGDLLIEAAGGKLKNPLDLINTINSIAPGTWLPLKLVRNNKIIEVVAKFKR
ncbi:MAG: PDZ domain-containing protein, partial [Rhodospirillaceae bacterium]|nr:PDZ domain-containing protein [Rhodospirillaceae bacterium]